MPEWVIHNYIAENFCDISKNICDEINRFIDFNPLEHDVNRIIINGHWDPEALLYLAVVIYKKWGYNGLKCMLHHNLLDYSHKLATAGKYGWLVRNYGVAYAINDIKSFVYKVLDGIVSDFSPILKILESGGDIYEVIQKIESDELWSAKNLKSFVDTLREPYIINFLKDLIIAVNELKECMDLCVLEVLEVEFYTQDRFRDLCPICFSSTYREDFILIPEEYRPKNLAFRVHKRCFEELTKKARELLYKGLNERETLRKVMIKFMPPSIVWEAVKRVRESQTYY
jgi:hypothetical protein